MTDTNKCYLCHMKVIEYDTVSKSNLKNQQWYCVACDMYFMAIEGTRPRNRTEDM